jgi:hypothetical protein
MRRIRISSVTVVLILLSSVVLHSSPRMARAQDECHLDKTEKVCGVFLRPGVRDEYKSSQTVAWSHTIGTLRGINGGDAQRRQLLDRYQDYAILASASDSIGDFQFDIRTVEDISDIRIYLPSNFTFAYVSGGYGDPTTPDKLYSVWTDITNDYSYISVRTLSDDDPIAPGWERIEIGRIPSLGAPVPSFTITPGLHHIRLFQVRAPFTAGLYHFKIYVDGQTIGDENFPIIIVKSSLQPAYVTGLVSLRELWPPVNASGRVVASGATADGKFAEAVAYFGPEDLESVDSQGSNYRYWLFGLPAGTYDLTASASGYLSSTSRIIVDAGQSLGVDFYLRRGTKIHVTIWSKDTIGPILWGNLWQLPFGTNDPDLPIDDTAPHRDILVRLFNEYDDCVGYWASDDIDPPYGPPWTPFPGTIDGIRNYPLWVLKPSTLPSSNSYSLTLTDARGLPSIRLDGHVPADAADLVEGIGGGSYRIEVQVTGYIMREADDYQRRFTVPDLARNYALQTDLRRSPWIMATAIIGDAISVPVSDSTLVIVVKSTDNFEKGLAAGTFPHGDSQYTMVVEGFNGIYNGYRDDTNYQDYGLEPVDYSLEVYMADMAQPSAGIRGKGWYLVEELSLDLCLTQGTVLISIAFHLKPSSVEIILRSTRMQQPVENSPWIFPGAGITLFFINELGNVTATLDPFTYGLIQDDGTIIGDPFDIDPGPVGWHSLLGVVFTGLDPGPVAALGGAYPTRIDEGRYLTRASTFGYLQRDDLSFYVAPGGSSDLQLDLVQGTEIRVELTFKHENMATGFNGFVRVELYNQQDVLVAASIYAEADPNPNLNYFRYDATRDRKLIPGAAEGAGSGVTTQPQRAFVSRMHYGIPLITWANWPAMIPSDANRLVMARGDTAVFDLFGFHSYSGNSDSRRDGLWANGWDTTDGTIRLDSGIRGSSDALDMEGWGNFTVRVWAFDPYGPDGEFDSVGPDGVFGTDDDYTLPDSVDGGVSDFRAYAQVTEISDLEAPWGGAAAVRIILEEQPSMLGVVSWIDMYGDQRSLPWAQIIEISPGDAWTSTATGSYKLWLTEGTHELYITTIGEEQLWEQKYLTIVLSKPGEQTFADFVLSNPSTPTPEFSRLGFPLTLSLVAVAIALSRRRVGKNTH